MLQWLHYMTYKVLSMSGNPIITIPQQAIDELESIREAGWTFRIGDLVGLVNAVAQDFLPDTDDGRLRDLLTERTLRHYQTLGCIDPPAKEGRVSVYGYRQYLQALLVRKLLYLGHTSAQIPGILGVRTNDGLLQLLLEGVRVDGAPPQQAPPEPDIPNAPQLEPDHWLEFALTDSLILRAKASGATLPAGRQRQLFRQAIEALRQHL